MSWLHPSTSGQATAPNYTGLQLQTAVNTLPVPIVWGENRIAPNVVWYANFQTQDGGTGGGKGLFSGSSSSSGTTYSADLILALCEGPIAGINQIWKGQSIYALSDLGLSLFNGTTPQARWGYLQATYPAQALSYAGTAYVCAANYQLDSSASISSHNFETQGIFFGSGINGIDADPALIINDFLTNPQYGLSFPSASINATSLFGASGDASLQTYCRALGIALSPALNNQEAASAILQRWLQLTNCAAVWTGGQLKFVPYGDTAISGNGYAFAPNLAVQYALVDNDFLDAKGNEDPIKASRIDPFSLPTIQRIEVSDRNNQYALTPVEARDQSQIDIYGQRLGPTITAHEICDIGYVGPMVAQLILQRALYVRAHFQFRLGWEFCLLDPMDIVAITDVNLGLSNFPVRIKAIEEDENGILTVTAEELTAGISTSPLYQVDGSASLVVINQAAKPAPVNAPVIFEPPPALTGGTPQLWVGASGGANGVVDPNWGGAYVWASVDGVTYSKLGTITQPAKQGFLTAPLPAAGGWDTTNALAITLVESGGALTGTTQAGAQAGVTLALVDGELLTYATASLTGANAYALTGLERGLYGTSPAVHGLGAPFARLDQTVAQYALPAGYIGKTIYLKLQSFNVFGGAPQSLAACTAYSYTPTGAGSNNPIMAQIGASGGTVTSAPQTGSSGTNPAISGGSSGTPSLGLPLDLGLVSVPATIFDDFGSLTAAVTGVLDLGNLTS